MTQASQSICGVFGKLPNYGDFLSRDLPSQYTDIWDAWLQNYVSGSQEQLGEHWLDIYLTSPIWRFTFSPGVIDDQIWLGLMIPSVDRVGRYFPFSVVCSLQTHFPVTTVHEQAHDWFEAVETILFDALEGQLQLDELLDHINALPLIINASYQTQASPHSPMGTVTRSASSTCNANELYPLLLDTTLKQLHTSYSLWSTAGSQYVEPCMFACKAMPATSGIAAMLDGDWGQSRWCEPFLPLVQTTQTVQTTQAPADPTPTPLTPMQPTPTPQENILDDLRPAELEPEKPLSQDAVYIPEDFLEDEAFSDISDSHSNRALEFEQVSPSPKPIAIPPVSPDITQPRLVTVQPQAVADEMNNPLPDNPFEAASGQPIETTDSPFSDQPAVSDSEAAPVLDTSGFADPFAGSASIALDAGNFEISGVDASDIEISDVDPFGLASDPNNSDNPNKPNKSES